jgi:hypothetical protein
MEEGWCFTLPKKQKTIEKLLVIECSSCVDRSLCNLSLAS